MDEERAQKTKELTAVQSFTGGLTGLGISAVVRVRVQGEREFGRKALPESETVRQISITVRTIVEGLSVFSHVRVRGERRGIDRVGGTKNLDYANGRISPTPPLRSETRRSRPTTRRRPSERIAKRRRNRRKGRQNCIHHNIQLLSTRLVRSRRQHAAENSPTPPVHPLLVSTKSPFTYVLGLTCVPVCRPNFT